MSKVQREWSPARDDIGKRPSPRCLESWTESNVEPVVIARMCLPRVHDLHQEFDRNRRTLTLSWVISKTPAYNSSSQKRISSAANRSNVVMQPLTIIKERSGVACISTGAHFYGPGLWTRSRCDFRRGGATLS